MTKDMIRVGGVYIAKVSNKLTKVKVIEITKAPSYRIGVSSGVKAFYHVTNLTTGRKTTFRSAGKFRKEVTE